MRLFANIIARAISLLWRSTRLVVRLLYFLTRGSTIILIVMLLSLNVASLTLDPLNRFLSSAIGAIAAFGTVADFGTVRSRKDAEVQQARALTSKHQADLKKAQTDLDSEKRRAAALGTTLKNTERDLGRERFKTKYIADQFGKLTVDNRKLRAEGPMIDFGGEKRAMKDVVHETAEGVKRRTARVATANLGSMAGEAIPFWGVAVIVAATTYELASACETMKDMQKLQRALAPDSEVTENVSEVCGMAVPSADELWNGVKASPTKAWQMAEKYAPTLPEPDFSGWLSRMSAWADWGSVTR